MGYHVRIDLRANRLYLTLTGEILLDEMRQCREAALAAIARLKRGFDVVTDIAQFSSEIPEVYAEIEHIQAAFEAAGVHRGVRIVGDNEIAGLRFTRSGHRVGYTSMNVATAEEAEQALKE